MRDERTILVAINMFGLTGWQKRNGVFRYIGEGKHWNVLFALSDAELKAAWRSRDKIDGVIMNMPNVDPSLCGFAETDIPTVLFNLDLAPSSPVFARKTGVVFLHHDSATIGEMAAQHLLSAGTFRSFVFLAPTGRPLWSEQRGKAFSAVLKRCGHSCMRLDASQEIAEAVQTLRGLEKPIGMFAASDKTALQAFALARAAALRVPDELAILGVDNDESICESTKPALSSISTDPESLGYAAAQLLDGIMARPRCRARSVNLRCKLRVVARGTTPGISPYGRLVEKAVSYIEAYATDGIGPNDVAKHLGISRRLLDLRFSQILHRSVLSLIQDCRLKIVTRKLAARTSTIERVTEECGYASPNHLKKLFKRRFGMSMRQWQALHATPSARES